LTENHFLQIAKPIPLVTTTRLMSSTNVASKDLRDDEKDMTLH